MTAGGHRLPVAHLSAPNDFYPKTAEGDEGGCYDDEDDDNDDDDDEGGGCGREGGGKRHRSQDFFLDASAHLYKKVCPSARSYVCPYIDPSICPFFRLSVCPLIRPLIRPFVHPTVHMPASTKKEPLEKTI